MTTTYADFDPAALDSETQLLCRKHFGSTRASLGAMLGGMVEISSAGPWVQASDGRRYLDFGGYGVYLLGHRHPVVTAAVHRQLDLHPMATRVFLEPVAARTAAALAAITPGPLEMVHFVNSGAEATEAALKLARANGKNAIVTTANGFHGKTLGALSVTAKPIFQDPFRPLLPEVTTVPFGDIDALTAALAVVPGRGCVIVEPVQGEGGVRIPPPGYLRAVSDACRAHDALLIVDEIQTGLGRLGTWWGIDVEDVVPDILLVGKGLSGGVVPIAAMVATAAVYQPFSSDPYLHTSTFAASPLACAAAEAAISVIREENLTARAADLGAQLLREITAIIARHPAGDGVEIRGRGLLIGLEFREPAAVGELFLGLIEQGVLANHSLNSSTVLRFSPPAVLEDSEIGHFLTAFETALAAAL
ncbi:aspartate aminotransferase family protein [Nocardia sp. NPDC058058]|uniref:aspartate aminotransferase family protein n=1 Tax=Nocardia sp. NPDC058058 TaxID=3346317 RepID=UPI0036D89FC1